MLKSDFLLKMALLAAAAVALNGCDFFRSLAGRPTSADIAAKREKMELEETMHRSRIDSLNATLKTMVDSISFADSVRMSGSSIVKAGRLSGFDAAQLPYRYYIVIGSFSNRDNAERQASAAIEAGFEVVPVEFRNGFNAVMICPSDNLSEIYEKLKTVKSEKFCPPDVWVLANE